MGPLDLTSFFRTKQQADIFLTNMDSVLQSIYSANFNLETALQQHFGQVEKEKIVAFLRAQNISTENPTQLNQFLGKIKEMVASLPVLNITLAFLPKDSTLKSISDWFMLNYRLQVLLNVKTDTNLIAGAFIDFRGKHFEYSIGPKVTEILNGI